MNTEKSEQLFKQAVRLMPGGVNSPVRAFRSVGRTPLFIERALGDRIYDVDGNEYIDYVCSWGPGILGHARKEVIEAVKQACGDGLTFGAPTKKESELAELIQTLMPVVEKVRLVNSGTEAVMSAIRVARGYTGRDLVIKFSGCYHGHSDGMLVKSGSGLLTNSTPNSAGVPKKYSECTLVAEYNDIISVIKLFDKYPGKIACVIVEPVAANMGVVPPEEEFLEGLRVLTRMNGSLLIFDEVITGFRLAPGGACEYFGVEPDIVTLGKIVGGGMPLAAYGGRKDIMDIIAPEGPVYQAGTLSGNPIAVTAGISTLKILLDDTWIYDRINKRAQRLEKAFSGKKHIHVNRAGSLLSAFFTDKKVDSYTAVLTSDTKEYARFFSYMLERGIYIAPSQYEALFVSDAHTDDDIDKTIQIISEWD